MQGDRPVKRREFIALVGGAVAWPKIALAQLSGRTRRVGVLFALPENDPQAQSRLAVFRSELRKLGWADLTIEARYVALNDAATRERYARELVALQPDLILSQTTDTTEALLKETRTIPIVFTIVGDPVGRGFVESFPRPGRNVTGFITAEPSMGGKWLEMLREVAPDIARVLVPFNSSTAEYYFDSLKVTASRLGIDASFTFVRDVSELETTVAAYAREPHGGLIVMPDAYITGHRIEMTALAARHRLPAVYAYRFFADSGGLLSYGSDLLDNFRRAAIYADRILKGEKPSELPVQAPEKFELVINLKAAKALGLDVSPSLLARAHEVIE
jgi:putative ABC transport system substrate-binding protein